MLLDPSGRGPSMRRLMAYGLVFVLVLCVTLLLLFARYLGKFEDYTPVTAALTTTGDGLPQNADVKYRGVLVGSVHAVDVAALGTLQNVQIRLDPTYAGTIPYSVTARVVPSNLFAVTSVELIDNGPGPALQKGAVIEQDQSKATIALQSAMTSLHTILASIDPAKTGRVLATIADALDGNGAKLGTSLEQLDRLVSTLAELYPNGQLERSLDDFSTALHGINTSAPELITVLGKSIEPARMIATKREQFAALLVGLGGAVGTVNTFFGRQPAGAGIELAGGLNQVFGGLASDPSAISESVIVTHQTLNMLSAIFSWNGLLAANMDFSLTPFKTYAAVDCPRYADMYGPRCNTDSVPSVGDTGAMPAGLIPKPLPSAGAGPPPTLPIPLAGLIPQPVP